MKFKVKLAKLAMNLVSSNPKFDIKNTLSENINHKKFINAKDEEKKQMMLEMARSQYLEEQHDPFDNYFPNYSFQKLLSGKKVLDLGCWCGGKSVSYAEKWKVKKMYGIDVNEYFIIAAKLLASKRKNKDIEYDFRVGFSEALPYEDNTFDAIVSWDVIEHVKSVKKTLMECKRTLKPDGMLFTIFPSYYMPFGGAHLTFVTETPFIQWFFDSKTLSIAFDEIIESRGEEAYWYKSNKKDWQILQGGIGINGITFCEFKTIVKEVGFSKIKFFPTPLLSVGLIVNRFPKLKYILEPLKPLLKIDILQDYLSHRIISTLVK